MARYLYLLIEVGPRFTKEQIKTVVDILVGLGFFFLGATSLPAILHDGPYSWSFAGVAGAFGMWYLAVKLSRRLSND